VNFQPRVENLPPADVEFLASRHYVTKTVTIDASTVPADGNGDKILKAGTVLGKITASGLYGPYDPGAADGRETADCILLNSVNCRDGNQVAAAVTHGVVYEARVTGLDGQAKQQLARIEFR